MKMREVNYDIQQQEGYLQNNKTNRLWKVLLHNMILDHSDIVPPHDSGMNSQQAETYAGIILNASFITLLK